MSQSGERPIVVVDSWGMKCSPPGRRRSGRRAPAPPCRCPRAARSPPALPGRTPSSCPPPTRVVHERSAALRAEVRGLRVLKAALGTVDVAQGLVLRSGLGRRRCLAGEDLGQPVDVDLAEWALPRSHLPLQAGDELCAQDVDLPVQQPAPVRDFCSSRWRSSISCLRSESESVARSGKGSKAGLSVGGSVNQSDCEGSTLR